jgi:hypothetical protein
VASTSSHLGQIPDITVFDISYNSADVHYPRNARILGLIVRIVSLNVYSRD